jgi:hypothetical protein
MDAGIGGGFGGRLTTSDTSVYVAFLGHVAGGAPDAHTRFARSEDGGITWQSFSDPCGTNSSGMEMDAWVSAAGPGATFGILCLPRDGRGDITLTTSRDGGSHFGLPLPLPGGVSGLRQSLHLAIPSANVEVVASASPVAQPGIVRPGVVQSDVVQPGIVVRSEDGGRTWEPVLRAPSATPPRAGPDLWLGFEDAQVGRISFGTPSVWTSNDGGKSWRESLLG